MEKWTNLSKSEIERRRIASVGALAGRNRAAWDMEYQQTCDSIYWKEGQCCAGCDHWKSDMALSGRCAAAPIMSGEDVIKSLGWSWSTYTPPPGHPFMDARDSCGAFTDNFDWSTLDRGYLSKIGALEFGELRRKPEAQIASPAQIGDE